MVTLSNTIRVSNSMEHGTNRNEISEKCLIALFKVLVAVGLIVYILLTAGCASTSDSSAKQAPLWVTDCSQAYPAKEYIAATGTGATAQESVVSSTAALSRYFNTQITSQSANSRTMTQNEAGVTKTRTVNESTDILSSTTLKALHSTEPYFVKADKSAKGEWIAASYIKRSEAWSLLEGELNQKKAAFDTPYDNALAQKDTLVKVLYLAAAKEAIPALQEELLYAKVISASRALFYADEDERMANCVTELTQTSIACPISIEVEGDLDNIVYSALVGIFGENGLCTADKNTSPYSMKAVVSMGSFSNEAGVFFYPAITVTLSTGSTVVFTYSKSCAKTGAKEASVAESRAYREIKKELADSLFSDLSARMGGK
jgi:hypothetical protein